MVWQSTLPTAQLLPVTSAPVIISPHRSNGINAGFVLVHSLVPEAVSCRKAFPISEEETDGGDLRSNYSCSTLLKINSHVNTELVLNTLMKLTGEPK